MSLATHAKRTTRPPALPGVASRYALLAVGVVVALAAQAGVAQAAWPSNGSGDAAAKAHSMPAGNQPTTSASGRNVTVNWSASSFAGGGPAVDGYLVKRDTTGGSSQTIGSSCSGTIAGLTCTESNVAAGDWKYSVTPVQGNDWSGAESPQSASVTVGSPNLAITSPTTITSLPTTLSGNISNFITDQTVSFKLDDPSTGTALTGSITPSPVPSNGGASVSVTIPAGTSNSSHTVYAIGSQGDQVSAAITVSVAQARTFTTSAWTVSDLSSGTASDTSDPYSALGGPLDGVTGFPTSFDTSKYVAFEFNGPQRNGLSTANVEFNFDYLGYNNSTGAAAQACFYFDVRRISSGSVLATHGSAGSPVDCNSALAFNRISTSLPEVTDSDIANDLQIRVYMTNTAAGYNYMDRATVTGSEASNPFTLYRTRHDPHTFGSASWLPWSLNASGDGALYTSAAGWDNAFSASKYLNVAFPSYVPSGATGVSATFKHAYKSSNSGKTTCWYFEVYNGSTLLATHGSASTPVSCNSTTSFVTDTVPLPEVNNATKANNVVIRIYAKNDGTTGGVNGRRSEHDLATLKVDYTG